jgi:hypothetical protein
MVLRDEGLLLGDSIVLATAPAYEATLCAQNSGLASRDAVEYVGGRECLE